jgi:transcriptional regulator with XRE-family HTH domain
MHPSPSRSIAAEVRAEVARQGLSLRKLALQLGVSHAWVTRRVSFGADVDLTLEDVDRLAAALGVPTTRLIVASHWLPRLDSNQEPSGLQSPQVRGGTATEPFGPRGSRRVVSRAA